MIYSHAHEFMNPSRFIRFFEENKELEVGATSALIIDELPEWALAGQDEIFDDEELPDRTHRVARVIFNRLLLAIGKCTLLTFDIKHKLSVIGLGSRIIVRCDGGFKLEALAGPLYTGLGDFYEVMRLSSRSQLKLLPDQQFTILDVDETDWDCKRDKLMKLFFESCPKDVHFVVTTKGSTTIVKSETFYPLSFARRSITFSSDGGINFLVEMKKATSLGILPHLGALSPKRCAASSTGSCDSDDATTISTGSVAIAVRA